MKPATRNCNACGWPTDASICPMCSQPVDEPRFRTGRAAPPPFSGPRPEDYPELQAAFRAWKVKNHVEMVELTLSHLGIRNAAKDAPRGLKGWTTTLDSAAIYISLLAASGDILVESPIVWIPQYQRVPLMRTLLELNASLGSPARFAVRGSTVLLRYTDHVHNISPPKLLSAVREVAQLADAHDNWLAEVFGCEMIGPEAIAKNQPWSYLGRQTSLGGLAEADTGEQAPIAAVETYADELRRGLVLVDRHDPESTSAVSGMIVRATINLIRLRHSNTSPTAVSMLLQRAAPVIDVPHGREPPAGELVEALRRFLRLDLALDRLAPAPLPPVTPLGEPVRTSVARALERVRSLRRDEELLRFLLRGLASELILRAPLRGSAVQGLRDAIHSGTAEDVYKAVVGVAR